MAEREFLVAQQLGLLWPSVQPLLGELGSHKPRDSTKVGGKMAERRMSQDFRGEVQLKAAFIRPLKATGVGRPQGKPAHTKHKPAGEAAFPHLGGSCSRKDTEHSRADYMEWYLGQIRS